MDAIMMDVTRFPLLHKLAEVMPFTDLAFGGVMMILVILVHAIGVRSVTSHVVKRTSLLQQNPSAWLGDMMMMGMVSLLLLLHVFEIFIWAAALVESGVVPDWRSAGFFAGNTYTTIGYGTFVLPQKWGMMAPIIAISGLFTFGWSCAVLVDMVNRCQKIRDAVIEARTKGP